MMNIPDGSRSRNKQEIQSVYRGRKELGRITQCTKKKSLTLKELQTLGLSQSEKSGLRFWIFTEIFQIIHSEETQLRSGQIKLNVHFALLC